MFSSLIVEMKIFFRSTSFLTQSANKVNKINVIYSFLFEIIINTLMSNAKILQRLLMTKRRIFFIINAKISTIAKNMI